MTFNIFGPKVNPTQRACLEFIMCTISVITLRFIIAVGLSPRNTETRPVPLYIPLSLCADTDNDFHANEWHGINAINQITIDARTLCAARVRQRLYNYIGNSHLSDDNMYRVIQKKAKSPRQSFPYQLQCVLQLSDGTRVQRDHSVN